MWADSVSFYLRSPSGWAKIENSLCVRGGLVKVRPIQMRDGLAWSQIRRADQQFLQPWELSSEREWGSRYALRHWPSVWWGMSRQARAGMMLPFAIDLNGQFCGQVTIGNILRGALLSAWIGYWVHSAVTGQGVASAAVALGVDYCFGSVGLHRLEATVRPDNYASRAVLAKLGFRQEGLLERYLHVDGQWRDHLLFGLTREEISTSVVARLIDRGDATWA